METKTCKLYSGVFWIFLPNFIKIDPYNFELYRFKVGAFFWDTVYSCLIKKLLSVKELTSSRPWLRGLSTYSKLHRRSGSRACRMWFLSLRIPWNKLSSISSMSSAAVRRHSPERTPQRITASTRCRSAAVAKPHQALAAYVSWQIYSWVPPGFDFWHCLWATFEAARFEKTPSFWYHHGHCFVTAIVVQELIVVTVIFDLLSLDWPDLVGDCVSSTMYWAWSYPYLWVRTSGQEARDAQLHERTRWGFKG